MYEKITKNDTGTEKTENKNAGSKTNTNTNANSKKREPKKTNTKSSPAQHNKTKKPVQKPAANNSANAVKTAEKSTQKTTQKTTQRKAPQRRNQNKNTKKTKNPVKITFLGGLNEIGKNITLYECGDDMFLADCGMAFPGDEMPGIDLVIPDFSYLEKVQDKIKGIVLTHGHEDHIGAVPYFLKKINVPIYGTRLTLGLLEGKLREHGLLNKSKLNVVNPGQAVQLGSMTVEFINVNHSIPDAVGFAIHTPEGVIIHTGDFKIDSTPIQGDMIDLGRFSELGREGVLCMLADSTNAERPGMTLSERTVGESFNRLFQTPNAAKKRIIIATFASNVHRIQQIIDYAEKYGRKVAVSGRSMINAVTISTELGYLRVPEGIMIDMQSINKYPKNKVVLITTGSQGEPMSALSRMASADHRQVAVGPEDFIIISATPIPGNEKTVSNVVNELMLKGCDVVYEKMYDVHVSGHACQEELKIMLSLTKPKFFIPLHGEQKHMQKHALLARNVGIPESSTYVAQNGDIIEFANGTMKKAGVAPHGKIMVDGLGVGDVGNIVLRDRKHLGEDGLIIVVASIDAASGTLVSGPDVVSRGFVYVKESEELLGEVRKIARDTIYECSDKNVREWTHIKSKIRDNVSKKLYEKTKRSPMILPIIMEV